MAQLQKIDSNVTGLRYAVEAALGILPPDAKRKWTPLEPNSYNDFGGQLTTIARNPINPSRQRKKGVVTDLEASGGFTTDLTQENMQDLLQGFFFADSRRKGDALIAAGEAAGHYELHNREVTAVAVNAAGTGYAACDVLCVVGAGALAAALFVEKVDPITGAITEVSVLDGGAYNVDPSIVANAVTDGTGSGATVDLTMGTIDSAWQEGSIALVQDMTGSNNGLKTVAATGLVSDVELTVDEAVTAEPAPAGTARISRVAQQFAAGDIDAVAATAGNLPRLTSTLFDFTTLGLIPGEWVFVGGDIAAEKFVAATNNGYARVFSVAANELIFDKTQKTMVDEVGAGLTLRVYTGRVLKNEVGTLIKRRTYQLERTLGAPSNTSPDQQGEYLVGAVPNEFAMNIPTAEKLTADLSFVATDNEQVTAGNLKAGARPPLSEADAFNTSSDFSRIKMSTVPAGGVSNPEPLFGFVTELTLSVNNNASPNKAVGTLGAFEVTAGTFTVAGSVTAYFSDIAAVQAVRNNSDITLDFHLAKANAGVTVDIPLITLGDGRANVEQDQPITLPLSMDAATGAKYSADMDHTLLMVFFDYLPNAADS